MINNWQERILLMLGDEALAKLHQAHVLVAGLGGVGAMAAEMLCWAGIGRLAIVDADKVQAGNRNRQILALKSTEGREKIHVMPARLEMIG